MHVDSSKTTRNGKTYHRHLLRESYREANKVKHRTIANLSRCSNEEIEAIRLALRHKGDLEALVKQRPALVLRQGLSVGALWTLFDMARQLGIERALGDTRQGRLALWQVIARVIHQGSRLSAVRLAGVHAACDVLGLDAFNEEDLYGNLDWLCEHQEAIEKHLSHGRAGNDGLFLYDVTSSYLEGTQNELGAFGYNRDRKRGKMQIVIGLLCDGEGDPLSIEVFEGNTQDTRTFGPQIRKVAQRFGGGAVTFVGDRGMIKAPQIQELGAQGFHYITAITKDQIRTLLRSGTIQMELFDTDLAEVCAPGGERYVLRRNPVRAQEMAASREDKLLALHVDAQKRGEAAQFDGCYVLKTDLTAQMASKEIVHGRYKDLALVEEAFRTSKTAELEIRPIHVRLATRTRGHALVVMLAYRIARELSQRWASLDIRVQEGLDELAGLCVTEIVEKGRARCSQIPEPRESSRKLLEAAKIRLPEALACRGVVVSTKKKLPERRSQN